MLPSGQEVRVPIRLKVNGLSCDVQIRLFRLLQMPERKFGDKVNSSSGTGLLLLEASDGMPASRAHSPAVFIMQLKIVLRSWMKTRRQVRNAGNGSFAGTNRSATPLLQ